MEINKNFIPDENNDWDKGIIIDEVKKENVRATTYLNESKDMSNEHIGKKVIDLVEEIKSLNNSWTDNTMLIIKSKDWAEWSILSVEEGESGHGQVTSIMLRKYNEKNNTDKKTDITIWKNYFSVDWKDIPSKMVHQVFEKIESEIDEFKEYKKMLEKNKIKEEAQKDLEKEKEAQKEIGELMDF